MSRVKANIVANYLGQGWAALMSLAFIPLYIRYLGIEAYGLIGFFAVMQVWLRLIDMGMTPTLNREMARFTSGAHSPESIRDLLRSLECVCFALAAAISLVVWGASGYIAKNWVRNQQLPDDVVAHALAIFAVVLALRFCESIYRGALLGLQRQVWLNSANAVLATLRHGGAVCLLAWASPTIEAFFIWQGILSLLMVVVFASGVYSVLPAAARRARISRKALAGVWKFAGGMMGITLLGLLLTQVDKLLLTRLLPLETFGYYALATAAAGTLSMMVNPIMQSIYPRMVELATAKQESGLISIYHQGAQLITVVTATAAMLLSVFAEGVVFMWSGDLHLAGNVASILSILIIGTFLNGLMRIPFLLQLAHGWTSLTIKINTVAVLLLIPAVFSVVPYYGAVGAAWIWVILNSGYVFINIQFMHRRLIPEQKWRWYLLDVLLPAAASFCIIFLAKLVRPELQNRLQWLAFLLLTGGLALTFSALFADNVRNRIFAGIHRLSGYSPIKMKSN